MKRRLKAVAGSLSINTQLTMNLWRIVADMKILIRSEGRKPHPLRTGLLNYTNKLSDKQCELEKELGNFSSHECHRLRPFFNFV